MPSSLTTLLPPALGSSPHPPVSVYGTGPHGAIAAFLDRKGPRLRYYDFAPHHAFALHGADLPTPKLLRLHRACHPRLRFPSRVPAVLSMRGAGIFTCCPSDTHFCLSLGPDLPRADQLYPGNLGYSAWRIPTSISLLIPAFSLLKGPRPLPVTLRPLKDAPLPIYLDSAASVWCFSPGHFRRRTSRPVSCYALFQWMAASEPTSWLS